MTDIHAEQPAASQNAPETAPQADKVLELKDVGYYFSKKKGYMARDKFWALKSISFTLRQGESLGVIGRNGAGKTTLLRLLAGILEPDQGTLVNHGFKPTLLSLQAGFIPYLSGYDNTILNGMVLGLKRKDILARMDDITSFAGLGDFFRQPIYSYSAGMRARLGFAIALQLDPDILLIDEVLGVGDQEFKEKSSAKMKEKIQSNKTVVLVSHSAGTVIDLCDKAVWIEHGETVAEGDAREVVERYHAAVHGKK